MSNHETEKSPLIGQSRSNVGLDGAFDRRTDMFLKTEEENKKSWLLHVANTLGFKDMPQDLLPKAETLYNNGYMAYQAVDSLKRLMTPNIELTGVAHNEKELKL